MSQFKFELDLERLGIKETGASPLETSIGLNQALQYAKEQGFNKIIFPTGTYIIDEANPIVIDLKNTIIDLNGSTMQINTNGSEVYSIFEFRDGAENVKLTNGTVRGDKDTHDYLTIKGSHEWGCGIIVKTGYNLQIDNMTVTNVTGYGISIESGIPVTTNRFHTLYTRDVVQGGISDDGIPVESTALTRTAKPYDISMCGGQFELGYTLGYLGYPYLLNREYTAYFYDKDMNFIQKTNCLQFKKVVIPFGSQYVHFVYPQATIVSNIGYYGWITNLKPPINSKLTNCLIKGNRCLGLAVCGGQQWTIENNIFEGNGGAMANYAVDFEDGFELIQDYVFKNNKFVNNNNDLVVAAGDNLVFEGNEFQKTVYIWERTTNYKVIGNWFNGGSVTYRIKRELCEVRDNQYSNSAVRTASFSSLVVTLTNEIFTNSHLADIAPGTKLNNCTIKATGKPYIKNAIMENCTLEVASAEAISLVLKNCKINNSKMNLHTEQLFESCIIADSTFFTYSDTTRIQLNECELVNSQMNYGTSGNRVETIFNLCMAIINKDRPLVRLSAGKTRNLLFKNNTVINRAAKPIIELYDTTYTIPDGNSTMEGNNFTQTNYKYIFDGVNITKGIFNFTDKNNSIIGSEMLNPKYIGNQYFNIIR